MSGALQGVKVLEIGSYVTGPYAGMLLGDLGAEVIKVENKPYATLFAAGAARCSTPPSAASTATRRA